MTLPTLIQVSDGGSAWHIIETETVLFLSGIVGVVILVLTIAILSKAVLNAQKSRQNTLIEDSMRETVYRRLAMPDADWQGVAEDLSEREREVLVRLLERGTDLLTGSAAEDLDALAEAIDLRHRARTKIESSNRYERLRGLTLFIEFGWVADPEWLLECTADAREEAEAAIRILANDPNPVTRLAGLEAALRQPSLSVYGTDALNELLAEDPAPLLEQLDRQDVEEPALLTQLLGVLVYSETATGDAPMDGVLSCLEHESAQVRGAACAVLSKYGWRAEVRDKVDLMVAELFDDPSVHVRIRAYEMLSEWGDSAALAKLARAAEFETNSRAKFAIARGLGSEVQLYLARDETQLIDKQYDTWTEVSELGIDRSPQLP